MVHLHLDFETYSSENIKECGSYKYFESLDFEILMAAYAFDGGPVYLSENRHHGGGFPDILVKAFNDPDVIIYAHNANFERNALRKYGFDIPASRFVCSAVKASYCGLPMNLMGATTALDLGDSVKSSEGEALIKFFCIPVKPTKANGFRSRNFPHHDPEKWQRFCGYCKQDVVSEQALVRATEGIRIPYFEYSNYILDQKINDRGVRIDTSFARKALEIDNRFAADLVPKFKELTGLDNPKSPKQLAAWLTEKTGKQVTGVDKKTMAALEKKATGVVAQAIAYRKMAAKTSTKKYAAMIACAMSNLRACGLSQFYGAGRTGRWAGRLIQLQNMAKNEMDDMDTMRALVDTGDYDLVCMLVDDVPSLLSQLVRSAIVPSEDNVLGVSDYSAIEARVIAWLSGETWRIKVFRTHGKIYEASAAMMFNVPMESITKGSDHRSKGKIAELALGYQGSVGALKQMGGEEMGLTLPVMKNIVERFRKANPAIVGLWKDFESCAIRAIKFRKEVTSKHKGVNFRFDGSRLRIELPSGRELIYHEACLTVNQWGKPAVRYKGVNQDTKVWGWVDTYGGKLTENVVQAIARDILADGMRKLDAAGFDIVLHVHDEVVAELPKETAEKDLKRMCDIMADVSDIYAGMPFPAEGFTTEFYKKD